MEKSEQDEIDTGTVTALLERAKRRIPSLQSMKQRLLDGDTLADSEIVELNSIMENRNSTRALIDKHPEYQELYTRMAALCEEVIQLALSNEKKGAIPPRIDLSD